MRTDTAHRAWNERWQTAAGRADWERPDEDVVRESARAYERGARRALDLGCGVGRHALHLARTGFETFAMDASESGLARVRALAAEQGLAVDARPGLMTQLPYEDASFDYVLAFNVIYHGDGPVVAAAIEEISRVLRPGGVYQGTMLSKRNASYRVGAQVAPDTWVRPDEDDKDHPHFYCGAAELVALFSGFELISLHDGEHAKPGTWHWHMVAERLD